MMVDFIQFVKEHPGVDLKIEYWHDRMKKVFPECFEEESDDNHNNA